MLHDVSWHNQLLDYISGRVPEEIPVLAVDGANRLAIPVEVLRIQERQCLP